MSAPSIPRVGSQYGDARDLGWIRVHSRREAAFRLIARTRLPQDARISMTVARVSFCSLLSPHGSRAVAE
jgi:hypothetical protein